MDPAVNQPPSSSTDPFSATPKPHEERLLGRALGLAVVVLGGFALFDLLLTGYRLHAAVEFSACAVVGAVAWQLRRGVATSKVLFPGTVAVAVVILVVVVSGEPSDGVLVWVALFPPIPFFLHGLRVGMMLSVGFTLVLSAAMGARVVLNGDDGFQWIASVNVTAAAGTAAVLSFIYESAREQTAQALRRAANHDALTGIANRRGFEQGFEQRIGSARLSGRPISLLVLDIDRLKQVNDSAGHRAGDALICHQVELIRRRIREPDLFGRIGGDELALLLPDTDLNGAVARAEELLLAVRKTPLCFEGRMLAGGLSIGAAQASPTGEGYDSLFAAADAGLYQAKEGGRARVVALPRIAATGIDRNES